MDEHLTFKKYMAQLRQKLNGTNGLLAKIRHQISNSLLKTIHFDFLTLTYAMQHKYRVFPTGWNEGMGGVPLHQPRICSSPPPYLDKSPPSPVDSFHQIFIPSPTKVNSSN